MRRLQVLPALAVLALVLAGSAFAAGKTPATTHKTPATTVTVKASNNAFSLSRMSVPLGRVTFVIHDSGTMSRDFIIAGHTSKTVKPGKHTSLTVTFTKAGQYPYKSTAGGHQASGVLHVTA